MNHENHWLQRLDRKKVDLLIKAGKLNGEQIGVFELTSIFKWFSVNLFETDEKSLKILTTL